MSWRSQAEEAYEEGGIEAVARQFGAAAGNGGDEPPQLTEEQGATVGRLARDFRATDVVINYEPFDLGRGWVLVQVACVDGAHVVFGISPEGRSHS